MVPGGHRPGAALRSRVVLGLVPAHRAAGAADTARVGAEAQTDPAGTPTAATAAAATATSSVVNSEPDISLCKRKPPTTAEQKLSEEETVIPICRECYSHRIIAILSAIFLGLVLLE